MPFADQGVEDIGQRHQAGGERNGVAGEALRIARAIPLFVVAAGNFTGNFEKTQGVAIVLLMLVVRVAAQHALDGLGEGIGADLGMALHDDELVGGQPPRLEQDGIRNADLADVVQRRCFGDQFLGQRVELGGELRLGAQAAHQHFDVAAGADEVIARFVVALLGQRGQRLHGHFLDQLQFERTLADLRFEPGILVGQLLPGLGEGEVGAHAGAENGRADRLGDVIDGTEVQAGLLIFVG